jgi:hypothetical protein
MKINEKPIFYRYLCARLKLHARGGIIKKHRIRKIFSGFRISKGISNLVLIELERLKLIKKISDRSGYKILFDDKDLVKNHDLTNRFL